MVQSRNTFYRRSSPYASERYVGMGLARMGGTSARCSIHYSNLLPIRRQVMTEHIPYFKIKFNLAVIGSIVQFKLPEDGQEPLLGKVPPSLLALMRMCWAKTPEERVSAQICLAQVKAMVSVHARFLYLIKLTHTISSQMDGARTPLPTVMPEVDMTLTAARPTVDRQKRVMKRPASTCRPIPRRKTAVVDTTAKYTSLLTTLEATLEATPADNIAASDTVPFEEQTPLLANGNGSSGKPAPTQNGKHAIPGEFGADDEDAPKGVAPVDATALSPNQVVVWQPYSFLPISVRTLAVIILLSILISFFGLPVRSLGV